MRTSAPPFLLAAGLAVCLLVAAPARAVDELPSAEFEVEVNLVVIDAVVTDRKGDHVPGLTVDDFELYEDGKLQEITDFSEVRAEEPAQEQPGTGESDTPVPTGRWFVLFFDQSTMTPIEMTRVRKAAREFVQDELQPQDRVAVFSHGAALKVLTQFTGDRELLSAVLSEEGYQGSGPTPHLRRGSPMDEGAEFEMTTRINPADVGADSSAGDEANDLIVMQDKLLDVVDFERLQARTSSDRIYRVLTAVGKSLARVPGRKTVILFSSGFDASLPDYGLFHAYREMVDVLNRSNVAIYTVDVKGLAGRTPGDVRSRLTAANIYLGEIAETDLSRRANFTAVDTLKVLAADTGGKALVHGSDLGDQLEKVARSTSSYYLLGYMPSRPDRKGFRDVKVKVKVKGARVLTRKGYFREKQYAEMSRRERKKQLKDALLSWEPLDQLPIDLRAEFYPVGRRTLMVVELLIRKGLLGTRGPDAGAEFMMYLAHQDRGNDIDRFHEAIPLTADDTLQDLRFVKGVRLKPGVYSLRTVMRDNVTGRLGSAGARLRVPDFDRDYPIISSLVLLTRDEGSRLLTSKKGGEEAAETFVVAGQQFHPAIDNRLEATGEVVVHYRVTNLKRSPETDLPRLSVGYVVRRDGELVTRQIVHYQVDDPPEPRAGVPIDVRFPLAQFGEGSYELEVQAYDVLAAKGRSSVTTFTVVPPSS